jgi:RNA polymerase sigma-70 factor (ECF subfamily)
MIVCIAEKPSVAREIANVLQVSEVTVHNHLSQSLKQIKDHFKALGYGIK